MEEEGEDDEAMEWQRQQKTTVGYIYIYEGFRLNNMG